MTTSRVARALTGEGIAVVRSDFTSAGSSDGDYWKSLIAVRYIVPCTANFT